MSGDSIFDSFVLAGDFRAVKKYAYSRMDDSRYYYPTIMLALRKKRPETALRWMKLSRNSGNFGPEFATAWQSSLLETGHYTEAEKFHVQFKSMLKKSPMSENATNVIRFESGLGTFHNRSAPAIDQANPANRLPFTYYSQQQTIRWLNVMQEFRLKAGSRFGYALNWFRTNTSVNASAFDKSNNVDFNLNQWQWNLWYSILFGSSTEIKFCYVGFQNASGRAYFLNPNNLPVTDTLIYNSNFYGISIRHHWRIFDGSIHCYRGFFYGNNQTQYGVILSLRPFENDNVVMGIETGAIQQQNRNNYWMGAVLFKLNSSVAIHGNAGTGVFANYIGQTGLLVFNTPETVKKIYSISCGYSLRKINLSLGVAYQERESTAYNSTDNIRFVASQAVSNYSFIHTSITWYP
jgi:hypothetical protein